MQQCQIVAHVLVPADQHATAMAHPTMRTLHHPPTGLVPCFTRDRLGFLASCPHMDGALKRGQQRPHLVIVIALVQAQPLRLFPGRRRPLDGETHDMDYGH
jgi:hypothetical protein